MNTQQALQKIDAGVPAQQQDPMSLLTVAVQNGATVETLERLAVLRKEFKAEQAKEAYFAALAALQAELPTIIRVRPGYQNRYTYAPLEYIVKVVTPFLNKHGFSHQEDSVVTENWVEAVITVTHKLGHQEQKRFKVPTQSEAGMSVQQKYGSAMTYATRYAFCAAFGIRTADRDTDCEPEKQSLTALKKELWTLLKPVRGTEQTWTVALQWLVDEACIDPDDKPTLLSDATKLAAALEKAKERL